MTAGQTHRLKRLEKTLFANADVFLSKVYGGFFGPKLWARIRSALQQPELKCGIRITDRAILTEKNQQRIEEEKVSNNSENNFAQLKLEFEQVIYFFFSSLKLF